MEKQKNKNHTQQPEVLACQGGGEFTKKSSDNLGSLETGKSKQYPSAEIKDPTDNWLELYTRFKNKYWRHGIIDKEEIVLLYDIL